MSELSLSSTLRRFVVVCVTVLAAYGCTDSLVIGEACDLLPGDLVISEIMPNPIVECAPYDDELACEDVPGCNWSDSCRNIETCRGYGDTAACGFAPGCAWTTECADTCASHTVSGACGKQVQDRVACEAAVGCAWDANDERCRSVVSCDSRADQSDCEQHAGCEWDERCAGLCNRHEMALESVSVSACDRELGCSAPDCQETADGCSLAACEDVAGCFWYDECRTSDNDREWFEIYNASSQTQTLSRIVIIRTEMCDDGTVKRTDHNVRGDVSVEADGYFVFGNGAVGVAPIDYSYDQEFHTLGIGENLGEMNNLTSTATYLTAGIELECKGRLIDRVFYGLGGAAPVPTAGYSLTFSGDLAPDAILNDRKDYWCSGGDTFDEQGNVGSPGAANVPCGLVRCQEGGVFRDAVPPDPGEIVISEALMDAAGGGDTHKYWIEIYIAADRAVDLRGLDIVTEGGGDPPDVARISGGLVGGVVDSTACVTAQPGQYVVIGETADLGDNDDLVVDGVAPGLSFSTPFKNEGGVIEIRRFDLEAVQEIVVDRAALPPRLSDESGRSPRDCREGDSDGPYDSQQRCECTRDTGVFDCNNPTGCTWNATLCEGGVKKYSGRTLALDGPVLGLIGAPVADLNDASAAFCYSPDDATGHFGGVGTPGLPNDPCGTVACFDAVLGEVRAALRPPALGLVISEVYPNPDGADVNKEWVELYVAAGQVDSTGADIGYDLNGIGISANRTGSSSVKRTSVRSLDCVHGEVGDYLLVSIYLESEAASITIAENGGVIPDVVALTTSATGFFTNASTSQTLHVEVEWGGILYDAADIPGPREGRSGMLSPQSLSVLGNNDPTAFCEPVVKYPDTFEGEGTPGARNVCGSGCADAAGGPPRESIAPGPGDVVITEINGDLPLGYTSPPPYPAPEAGSDLGRDWLEVYSTASAAWDLNALTVLSTLVSSGSTRSFTVDEPLCVSVAPGTYAVLGGPEAAALDGVPVDAVLTGSSTISIFHEGLMTMAIEAAGVPIDQAVSVNPERIASWALSLPSITGGAPALANDDIANWCLAQSQINWTPPHAGNGSPGVANEVCP